MKTKVLLAVTGSAALAMATLSFNAAAHDEPVVGAVGGAAIGALAGGPAGAAVGAVIGAIFGTEVDNMKHHGHHAHVHHRHAVVAHHHRHAPGAWVNVPASERVAYAERHVYASNGTSAHECPPGRVVYRQTVVEKPAHRVKVSQARAKPQMKRVCKWVPTSTRASVASRKAAPVG